MKDLVGGKKPRIHVELNIFRKGENNERDNGEPTLPDWTHRVPKMHASIQSHIGIRREFQGGSYDVRA